MRKFMYIAARLVNKVERVIDEHKKIKAMLIAGAGVVLAGLIAGKPLVEAAYEGILLSTSGIAVIVLAA